MRFLKIILAFVSCAAVFGATKPVTYNPSSGVIVQPANFASANGIVSTSELSVTLDNYATTDALTLAVSQQRQIHIDTSATISYSGGSTAINFFTSDAEFKVMKGEDCVYWVSTTRSAENAAGYLTNAKRDMNAQIWFYCADVPNRDSRSAIWFESKVFTSIAQQAALMCPLADTPQINGIVIEPNLGGQTAGGTEISPLFQGGNYKQVYTRLSSTDFEKSSSGNVIYRSCVAVPVKTKLGKPAGYSVFIENDSFGATWVNNAPSGWTRGESGTAAQLTSGLPSGYTSGVSILYTGSASWGALHTDSAAVVKGKKYRLAIGFWAKSSTAQTALNFKFRYKSVATATLSTTWTYYAKFADLDTAEIADLTIWWAPEWTKLGITTGAAGAQITGLTVVILEEYQ